MLGYLTKNRQLPECLQGFPVAKQDTAKGTIFRLKSCTIANPHDFKLIPIDDNLSVFKIKDTFDPKDYQKPNPIGDFTQLNGVKLQVPKLRCFNDGTELPQSLTLSENGICYQVKQEHLKAFSLGSLFLDEWLTGNKEPTTDEIIDAVTTVLQINYYITRWDVLVYSLISTDLLPDFLGHCVDIKTRIEWYNAISDESKKKLLLGDSSGN